MNNISNTSLLLDNINYSNCGGGVRKYLNISDLNIKYNPYTSHYINIIERRYMDLL